MSFLACKFCIAHISFGKVKPWCKVCTHKKCMFGSAGIEINFKWIDFVKLILIKSEFKVKWFMFGYFI